MEIAEKLEKFLNGGQVTLQKIWDRFTLGVSV